MPSRVPHVGPFVSEMDYIVLEVSLGPKQAVCFAILSISHAQLRRMARPDDRRRCAADQGDATDSRCADSEQRSCCDSVVGFESFGLPKLSGTSCNPLTNTSRLKWSTPCAVRVWRATTAHLM